MRIFLGLAFLAVALAFPIDFIENGDVKVDKMDALILILDTIWYRGEQTPMIKDFVELHLEWIDMRNETMTREMFDKLKMWGKKWNRELIERLDYDDINQRIIVPMAAYTDDERLQYVVRAFFKSVEVRDEAIDDLFARKLHELLPMDKYSELLEWANRWNVKDLDKSAMMIYRKEFGREKERQWKVKASSPETPPAIQKELKTKLIRSQVVRDLAAIFARIREWSVQALRNRTLNASSNNLTEYEQRLIYNVYADVNKNVTEQLGPDQEDQIRDWNFREIHDLFSNTYQYTQCLEGAIANGEMDIQRGGPEATRLYNKLTTYERELVNGVYFDLEKKVAKQLGFDKDGEENNITY